MKLIRWLLGRLILLFDFVFTPRSKKRSAQAQQQLDTITQNLKLYQFKACPFCVKVRRAAKREGLKLETRDAKSNAAYRQELLEQGGKVKVPCLRIEEQGQVTWLYESSDIVSYLQGLERSA
ncbi:glutaredoxin family protein [Pseudoalteromonas luteoviolacea]|uniref:Glutaredoxin n=1 Tax=Pseudoalteromonas luteoviolacea H33 TaxID=1365251 RepID=A0A167EZK5_9GAMM|nr:glutaredoxin [Pseudoalteromonas luteoviolacea]KZN51414.1 glutaredoxin [Pseudoalteromonas luteoviolacea H33]KZN71415.1 glutaredoxin [Pseudoalteromonas luteoviolacea H33-S]MBQ4876771.1 glutaredoxin [Pseudoalteromonas luteoviolacea]MBQ4905440.1 glutaredoxin [Pseudoalteromonas luteoviolacea]